MSRNPPVPSRNALRLLRRLALSSTAFVGAVGSVCGLATLNHEARRRVKLAEKVVATKTILRSVSNGRGQAHVARMCEAAERGDDFTLDEKNAHKRRRVRHQSTLAFDRWSGDDGDILALQQSLQKLAHRPGPRSSELQRSSSKKPHVGLPEEKHRASNHHVFQSRISNQPPIAYRQPFPEQHSNSRLYSHPPSTPPQTLPQTIPRQSRTNSPAAERILAASQVPLKQDAHGVYARQTRQYATRTPRLEANATAVRSSQAAAVEAHDGEGDGRYLEFPHLPGSAQLLRDTHIQNSRNGSRPDHQCGGRRQRGKLSATDASSGIISDDSAHNMTASRDSPHASPQSTGISFLPDDGNAFSQWPGIPRIDEVLDNAMANLDDSEDATVGQESVGPGRETGHNDYFTALHNTLASSRSKSSPDHGVGHLEASAIDRTSSSAKVKAYRSAAEYAATETDGSVPARVPISEILNRARIQVRMLEKRGGIPTDSDMAQASEKIDMLCAQTDLGALRVSLYGTEQEKSRPAVLMAMTRCLDLETPSGLIDAEILYYAFNRGAIVTAIDEPCQRLISNLLKDEKSHSRVASILFPSESAPTNPFQPSVQTPYKAASYYLAWFCRQNPDPNTWIEEVWKVISLAQQRDIPLHDRLIRIVLKSLTLAKQPGLAQKLLDDARTTTMMEITFQSYGILIRSHVADGEWTLVQRMLESLHTDGLSRTRPIGFSVLFDNVLQEYVRQKPLNQAYDYLIDATHGLGLVPTSTMSSTLITTSLRQGRYDLIQDWVEFMHQRFPAADVGTDSAFSAWRVAQLWKERRSSCEEIECGCQAMAYGALRDPFSPAFRGVALVAVEADLRARMSVANKLWQYPSQVDAEYAFSKMNLKDIIGFVEDYSTKHPSSNDLPLRQREHFKDLLYQLTAVTRLNALFGGDVPRQKLQNSGSSKSRVKSFIPATEEQDPAEAAIEVRVKSSKFPDRSELWSMLSNVYVGRQRRGRKASHGILEYLIPHMNRTERMADALMMLASMYDSPYVQGPQGTPFTKAIFSMWLYVAVELKDRYAISKALWALVDSGIDMGTDMLLLVRIVRDRNSSSKHLPDFEREKVTEECRYVLDKLRFRRWIRAGRTEKIDRPRFAQWQSWAEMMRRERLSTF